MMKTGRVFRDQVGDGLFASCFFFSFFFFFIQNVYRSRPRHRRSTGCLRIENGALRVFDVFIDLDLWRQFEEVRTGRSEATGRFLGAKDVD